MKLDAVASGAARSKTRIRMELKDVRLGKQDPQLLEIPPGYTKLSMGGFGPGAIGDILKQQKLR